MMMRLRQDQLDQKSGASGASGSSVRKQFAVHLPPPPPSYFAVLHRPACAGLARLRYEKGSGPHRKGYNFRDL